MAAYILVNKTTDQIHLIIPSLPGSGRQYAAILLEPSGAYDILPLAGTLENCKSIAQIYNFQVRGLIDVVIK